MPTSFRRIPSLIRLTPYVLLLGILHSAASQAVTTISGPGPHTVSGPGDFNVFGRVGPINVGADMQPLPSSGGPVGARVIYETVIGPPENPGIEIETTTPSNFKINFKNRQFDPIVAVHPVKQHLMVVTYVKYSPDNPFGLGAGMRKTTDGGRTWRETATQPGTALHLPSIHPALAWGRGPHPGTFRLYYINLVENLPSNQNEIGISYSDDEGETWSPFFLDPTPAPPLSGSLPDITADIDPQSPNYGAVYAVYNYSVFNPAIGRRLLTGLRVIASRDFGMTWSAAELDFAPPSTASVGAQQRVFGRLKTNRLGDLYVSFAQSDFTVDQRQPPLPPLLTLVADNICVQRLQLQPDGGINKAPTIAAIGLTVGSRAIPGVGVSYNADHRHNHNPDVDQKSGAIYLATFDYNRNAPPGVARGRALLGRSTDGGTTWEWTVLPDLPDIDGRKQSANRVSVAVNNNGNKIFVGLHGVTDVPIGTPASSNLVTVGNYYSVSTDGGRSFEVPVEISPSRWNTSALGTGGVGIVYHSGNGVGVRERSQSVSENEVVYVYGDARTADLYPSPNFRSIDIVAALLRLTVPMGRGVKKGSEPECVLANWRPASGIGVGSPDPDAAEEWDKYSPDAHGLEPWQVSKAFQADPSRDGPIGDQAVSLTLNLAGGSPNPMIHRTRVDYWLPFDATVRLAVHDVQGRVVAVLADGTRAQGWHSVTWNGDGPRGDLIRPGVYLVRLEGAGQAQVRRIVKVQ